MTTEYRAALAYLYQITDEIWERVCGDQSREQFAALADDEGESIETAWAEALAHADSL
jgi:hypothetical protein